LVQKAQMVEFTTNPLNTSLLNAASMGANQAGFNQRISAIAQERILQQLQDDLDNYASPYTTKINLLNERASRLTDLKFGITEGQKAIEASTEKFEEIDSILFDMKTYIEKAEANPDDSDYYAYLHNEAIKKLNKLVDKASFGETNLIGNNGRANFRENFATNSKSLKVTEGGSQITLQGVYLGTDDFITDENGQKWLINRTANSIQSFDSYPKESASEEVSIDGFTLDSFDDATDAVTFTVDGVQHTGTVTRGGLGVMNKHLYDNFASADGRARAADDIAAARTKLKTNMALLESQKTIVDQRLNRVATLADDLKAEEFDYIERELTEKAAYQRSLSVKATLSMQNLSLLGDNSTNVLVDFV
jgi:hypothetical protein